MTSHLHSLLARLCLAAAAVISGWLGWRSLSHQALPGCGADSACDSVLHSSWAWIGLVPLALVGALVYLGSLLTAGHVVARPGHVLARLGWGLLGMQVAAALCLLGVQSWVLGRWCPWCCAVHGLALASVLLLCAAVRARRLRVGGLDSGRSGMAVGARSFAGGLMAALASLAIAALALPVRQGQAQSIVGPQTPAKVTPSGDGRQISLHEGRFTFSLDELPVEGDPAARHVLVVITDPTCPHCRRSAITLREALKNYAPGELAVLFLPGTRDALLGPALQQMLLVLWKEKPDAWKALSQKLDAGELPAGFESVRSAVADALGGRARLDERVKTHQEWALRQIHQTSRLMEANAASAGKDVILPQFMAGASQILGGLEEAQLQDWLKAELALQPLVPVIATAPSRRDPCDLSQRSVCGRLVISILGAGEYSTDPNAPMNEPVENDKHAAESASHLMQFSRTPKAKLPVEHIVVSSDPHYNAWLKKQKLYGGSSVGITEATLPSFEDLIDPNSKTSPLNAALKKLAADPNCQGLMNGAKSPQELLNYLKVDILIDGELTSANHGGFEYGISAFRQNGTVGTLDRWNQDGTVIGQSHIDGLMDRLSGAVVQAFVKTCKSGIIGNLLDKAIAKKSTCGCYLSTSDEKQNDYSGAAGAPFTFAMPGGGKGHLTEPGLWRGGAPNVMSMEPSLLNKHLKIIMNPELNDMGIKEIVSGIVYRNPLHGFVYNSADAIANEALEFLAQNSEDAVAVKQLRDAEFVSELPAIDPLSEHVSSSPTGLDAGRVKRYLDQAKRHLARMIDANPREILDASAYESNINLFADCLAGKEQVNAHCNVFSKEIRWVWSKRDSGNTLTSQEKDFIDTYVELATFGKQIDIRKIWTNYIADKVPLEDFLPKMWKLKELFIDFKQATDAHLQARRSGKKDPLSADKKRAFELISKSFNEAYDSARTQLFEQLKKETITTRMAKLESAASLLAKHADELSPPGKAGELLARLSSKLSCLLDYPVGPAVDYLNPGPYPSSK